jgi:hypothetical protein
VPDVGGATCATCFTLNPAEAPACIRCNTPLPPLSTRGNTPPAGLPLSSRGTPSSPATLPSPPPAGADSPLPPTGRLGPGLAAPPRGTPGGSAAAAAPVQPPGYGGVPDADRVPRTRPASTPEQQRRIRRRIAITGGAVVAVVLAGGGGTALWLTRPHYVDTDAVAARLSYELFAQLREPVTVECRGEPRQRAGETFGCAVTNAQGVRQTVDVTILDDTGRYRWRLGR